MYRRVLALSAALIIVLSSFVIPSYADSFIGLPYSSTNYSSNSTISPGSVLLIGHDNQGSSPYHFAWKRVSDKDIYPFYNIQDNSVVFVSTGSVGSGNMYSCSGYLNNNDLYVMTGWGTRSVTNLDSNTGLYYNQTPSVIDNIDIPSYSDFNTGIEAVYNFINGVNPSYDTPFSLNYDLPAGNVIYIKTQNQDDVIALNTTFFTNSKLFSSTWSNITQCYQQNVSDLPSSGVQFPLSGMGTIPWIKSSDTNILGQTKSASFSFQSGSYDTWAVIYNPLYQNFAQPPQGDFNGSIHINAENCLDYYTYPLSGYLTSYSDNGMVSSSVSDYTDHYTVQRDENGDPVIDSNGNPVEINQNGDLGDPSFGGTNQTPESTNIIDYVKELGNILSNFTNNFLSLIQVPLSHIGQLIQSGTGFMSALRGMYAWLPVDIQGLVIAALSVVIGIGVFKVFL